MFIFPSGIPSGASGYQPAGAIWLDGSADYLTWTPSGAGSSTSKGTISFWFKQTTDAFGASSPVLVAGADGNNYAGVLMTSAERWTTERYNSSSGSDAWAEQTNGLMRDTTAWQHIVVSHHHTDSTAADRIKIYINGTHEDGQGSPTNPGTSQALILGSAVLHSIGKLGSTGTYVQGYLADLVYLDGQAIQAGDIAITDLGETDSDTGIWVPKDPSGLTFGNNGFWLDFGDGSDVGRDASTSVTKITSATYIGDMTSSGGLKAAFNNAVEGQSSSAKTGAAASYYIGQDHGSGNSKTVTGFRLFGPNDARFSNDATHTLKLYGSDSAPTSNTDGTQLWTGSLDDSASSGTIKEVNSSITTTTGYRYHWITVTDSDSGGSNAVSELQLFEGGTDLPNSFFSFSVNASNFAADGPANSTDKEISIYPTIDPVGPWGVAENTLSDNNMTWISGSSANKWNFSTIPMSNTDKVYMEFHQDGDIGGSHAPGFAVTKHGHPGGDTYPGAADRDDNWGVYLGTGSTSTGAQVRHDGSIDLNNQAGGGDGHVYMMARHGANIWFGANGTWYDSGDPTSASTAIYGTSAGAGGSANDPLPTDEPLWVAFHCYGTQAKLTWKPHSSQWKYSAPTDYVEMKSVATGVGNVATWNPIKPTGATLSKGNTVATIGTSTTATGTIAFDPADTDGYYWEYQLQRTGAPDTYVGVTYVDETIAQTNTGFGSQKVFLYTGYTGTNNVYTGHTTTTSEGTLSRPTWGTGDTIGVAVKAGKLYYSKNGTWIEGRDGTSASTTFNANHDVYDQLANDSDSLMVPIVQGGGSTTAIIKLACSSGDLIYAIPSGFKTLESQNLPEPTVTDPSAYFQTKLYTGSAGAQSITLDGNSDMEPDLVWIKTRSHSADHALLDSVRGPHKQVRSNHNADEYDSYSDILSSFDSDGFTLGADTNVTNVNTNARTYVAWCWKAGGEPSADNTESAGSSQTAGSVKIDGANGSSANGSIAVTRASANTTAGFSIITYTGTGSNGTVPHFLGVAPEFICVKKRGNGDDSTDRHWGVYHVSQGNTKYALLSDTNAFGTSSGYWNNTTPGTSTFAVGTDDSVNGNNAPYVAYCFARTPGLIGIGIYTSNDSTDGPHVIVDDGASGFRPAFVMLKAIQGSQNWRIHDSARDGYNGSVEGLFPNTSGQEDTEDVMDMVANGFKIRSANDNVNGGTAGTDKYVYIAFAEQPFGLNNRAR